MAHDGEFQEKFRQLGQLVARLDQLPDNECRVTARELVQLLMDLHGAGLERMLEIVFESGDTGQRIIDKLGQDQLTSSLLLLYSLHPDDLETRVHTAVERMRPRLRKLSCTVDSVAVHDGAVRISLTASGHGCGSSQNRIAIRRRRGNLRARAGPCISRNSRPLTKLRQRASSRLRPSWAIRSQPSR